MKERNISLDAMKGFAIFLVMIGHILNLNKIQDPYLYTMIEAVQMPVFIMISGYICGFKAPIETFVQLKSTISKRVISYVLPFFMWLFLKQWDNLAMGIYLTLKQLDRGLWFLMTLFLLNVILYITQFLNKQFRNKSRLFGFFGFCVIFGVLSGVFVLQILMHNSFLSPELTLRYIPPFLLGYFVSVYRKELLQLLNEKLQLLGFVISVTLFIYTCFQYQYSEISFVMQIAVGLLGCYTIFYIFLKSKENVIKNKLSWVGQYTLEIYTVHFHFATKLNPGGKLFIELYTWRGMAFVLVTFITMSIMSAGLIYLAKQVPITNLLMFGRKK